LAKMWGGIRDLRPPAGQGFGQNHDGMQDFGSLPE
jgi:hypothetical protein